MNLAFVLMVQGGTHPRGKTTVNVPAIDPDFDVSLLAAAEIFYLANTACLTPMSGFYDARQCTILHAGTHAAIVEAAWDAVGVASLPLTPGTPSTGLAGNRSEFIDFIPFIVDAGTAVTCTLDGDNGDADLFVSMVGGDFDYTSCRSVKFGSQEECTAGPLFVKSKVSVTVRAYTAFTGLTLSCTLQDAVELQDGIPVTGQEAAPSDIRVYILPDIASLQSITCVVEADVGLPRLELYAISDDGGFDAYCSVDSWAYEDRRANCTIYPLTAPVSLFAAMFSYEDKFFNSTLTCSLNSTVVKTILNWASNRDTSMTIYKTNFGSTFLESFYALDTVVKPNRTVTCLATKSKKNFTSEFTVYYGNSTHWTEACSAYSTDIAECTAYPTETSTSAFVKLDMYPYSPGDDDGSPNPAPDTNVSATILCGVDPEPVDLTNGVALKKQSGQAGTDSALSFYRLKGVRRGETVTCKIGGRYKGTPALYVRSILKPHPMSESNDCKKKKATTCTTPAFPVDSVVYAAVYAFTDYSGVSITCTRDSSLCGDIGEPCKKARDCCGAKSTCDGTKASNRKCKVGKAKGSICKRKSECAPGLKCKNGKCA